MRQIVFSSCKSTQCERMELVFVVTRHSLWTFVGKSFPTTTTSGIVGNTPPRLVGLTSTRVGTRGHIYHFSPSTHMTRVWVVSKKQNKQKPQTNKQTQDVALDRIKNSAGSADNDVSALFDARLVVLDCASSSARHAVDLQVVAQGNNDHLGLRTKRYVKFVATKGN